MTTERNPRTWRPSDYVRKGWSQGARARDVDGSRCDPESLSAVAWSTLGAVDASRMRREGILHGIDPSVYMQITYAIRRAIPTGDFIIEDWNDSPRRTKEEVLAVLLEMEGDSALPFRRTR